MSAELIAQVRKIASRGRMDDADVQIVFDIADALEAAEAENARLRANIARYVVQLKEEGGIVCSLIAKHLTEFLHPDNEGDET